MIVALSGYGGAGKDSVADILVDEFGFRRYAWADTLRMAAAALNPIVAWTSDGQTPLRYNDAIAGVGYNEAKFKFPEVRNILQRMGTEVGRQLIGDNVWVDATLRRIEQECSPDDDIVITDTRFKNEAATVKERSDAYVIRVNRPGVGPAGDHQSEIDLDDYPFDFTIDNGGSLEDLAWTVENLCEKIRENHVPDLQLF